MHFDQDGKNAFDFVENYYDVPADRREKMKHILNEAVKKHNRTQVMWLSSDADSINIIHMLPKDFSRNVASFL